MRTQLGQPLDDLFNVLFITTIDIFKIMFDKGGVLHKHIEIDVIHSSVVIILQYKYCLVFNFNFEFFLKCSNFLLITKVFLVDSHVIDFRCDLVDLLENFGLKLLVIR